MPTNPTAHPMARHPLTYSEPAVQTFTGEQTDANGQIYLRARYYDPATGVFTALDPFEGTMQRPMSMNGYSWVEGNPINFTDPTGAVPERPGYHHCEIYRITNNYEAYMECLTNRTPPSAYRHCAYQNSVSDCWSCCQSNISPLDSARLSACRDMCDVPPVTPASLIASLVPDIFSEDPITALSGAIAVGGITPDDVVWLSAICVVVIVDIGQEHTTSTLHDLFSDIFLTKRGNIHNEYNREAQRVARERNIDPCDYLRDLYQSASKAERQKIKQAQKALGCRRHR